MQRIESLDIKNFRGIKEGHIEGFADVNVLVGRNNCGKTSVMEAIIRICQHYGLMQDLLLRDVSNYWMQTRKKSQEHLTFKQVAKEAVLLSMKIMNETLVAFSKSVGSPLDHSNKKSPFASSAFFLCPQDTNDNTIEHRFWPQLLSNRSDKLLTSTLNNVFGLKAETFQMLPSGQLMVLFDDYSVPLDLQGDGTRTALRTMMILSVMKQTVLMLEEPECYQHPGSLERFAVALCKLAKQREVQLMISTHSIECVKAFIKGAKESESEGALFHLKLEDGIQQARRLDSDAIETLNATGVDVRYLDLYA